MPIVNSQTFNTKKKKYKRFFAFGCSFTLYHWPTWANILHFDMPQSEYYNFARPGAGNFFIYAQIVAAHEKYKFTEDDCISVLWSTHCREDKYFVHHWETPGNLWTQNFYDEHYLKNYVCVKGLLVRDLAIFQGAKHMFNALPCDTLNMYSVPVDYDQTHFQDLKVYPLFNLYKDIISDMKENLFKYCTDGHGGWKNGHWYIWPGLKTKGNDKGYFGDYHPNSRGYLDWLLAQGYEISSETIDYVDKLMNELAHLDHRELISNWFYEIAKVKHPNYHYTDRGVDFDGIAEFPVKNKVTFPI